MDSWNSAGRLLFSLEKGYQLWLSEKKCVKAIFWRLWTKIGSPEKKCGRRYKPRPGPILKVYNIKSNHEYNNKTQGYSILKARKYTSILYQYISLYLVYLVDLIRYILGSCIYIKVIIIGLTARKYTTDLVYYYIYKSI